MFHPHASSPQSKAAGGGCRRTALAMVVGSALLLGCSATDHTPLTKKELNSRERPLPAPASTESPEIPERVGVVGKRADVLPPGRRRDAKGHVERRFAASVPSVNSPVNVRGPVEPRLRERYQVLEANGVKRVLEAPVSTFSIDVDTGAYANVRRILNGGRLPPRHAVRVEEFINYFDYSYPEPDGRETPFSVHTVVAPAPWGDNRHLLRIGIKGFELDHQAIPPANLVFLIDVSGSMGAANKLGLLKPALQGLARRLRPEDTVAIVVYAGASGVVLEPTPGGQPERIEAALAALRAGGSTNGASGIRLAYHVARSAFKAKGVNRIILATDGDFNVGTTDLETLKDLVRRERASGVSLTTLGFGAGNYNEALMEQLANLGNGNYAYIDSVREANKVLGHQMAGTLATIAKDVKIQLEFNPAAVSEYRLVGYENRAMAREDFSNDKFDAGEIGAGHRVTALYEIVLVGSGGERITPLRYGAEQRRIGGTEELGFLKLRYKAPEADTSQLLAWPIAKADVLSELSRADDDFRFAAAVAGFGQWLRGEEELGQFGPAEIETLARNALADDQLGYRREFLGLVGTAALLHAGPTSGDAPKAIRISKLAG